jgi:hypothetical protein
LFYLVVVVFFLSFCLYTPFSPPLSQPQGELTLLYQPTHHAIPYPLPDKKKEGKTSLPAGQKTKKSRATHQQQQ